MVKTGFNWNRECPRFLADMTGHGRCDIVGFGIDGVWVARSDKWAKGRQHMLIVSETENLDLPSDP